MVAEEFKQLGGPDSAAVLRAGPSPSRQPRNRRKLGTRPISSKTRNATDPQGVPSPRHGPHYIQPHQYTTDSRQAKQLLIHAPLSRSCTPPRPTPHARTKSCPTPASPRSARPREVRTTATPRTPLRVASRER
eukprot:5990776-Pleurochrysis_carterae.AAC.1